MESIDIKSLENLLPQEYQDLISDPLKLAGVWESSTEGTKLFHQQQEQAQNNLEMAHKCEKSVEINAKLRNQLTEATHLLQLKHDEWQTVETEMHSVLEPWSRNGVRNRLKWALKESEDLCLALEQSWKPQDDPQAFINEYQRQAFLKHTRKLKLDTLAD